MATEYVVLQEVGLQDRSRAWVLLGGTIEAASNEAAIRRAVKDREQGGIFCAVPKRSWVPLEVNVKVERSMSIGEPGQFSEPEPVPEEEEPVAGETLDEAIARDAEVPERMALRAPDDDGDEDVVGVAAALAAAVEAGEMPADAVKPGREPPEGGRY